MTSASQLPKIPNIPKADSASPLPGFVTFAHLAARAGITPNHLRVTLSDKNAPKLDPTQRIGGMYLYNEAEADQWFNQFQNWRDEAPLRAAARKAEQERRVQQKLDEEQARLKSQYEILASQQQAQEEYAAAKKAYLKEQEETQRRLDRLSGRG